MVWLSGCSFLKGADAVVDITNLCLEVDKKNEVIHSKNVAVKVIDASILGRANYETSFERKEKCFVGRL